MEEESREDDLEALADEREPGIGAEFLEFLRHNKKWWLAPILLALLALAALTWLSGSAVAPFIYTLW